MTAKPRTELTAVAINALLVTGLAVLIFHIFLYVQHHIGGALLLGIFVMLFLLYCIAILYLFAGGMISAVRSRSRGAIQKFLAGIVLLLSLAFGRELSAATFLTVDHLRLLFGREYYDLMVQAEANHNGSKQVVFDWGSSGYLSTNFFYALVFDEQGELRQLSERERLPDSAHLGKKYPILLAERCASTAVRLRQNYYTVSTTCE